MTTRPDFNATEFPRTARSRARIPEAFTPARLFPGWGPELGR